MKQKTPEVSKCAKHELEVKKYRKMRRYIRLALWIVAVIYIPVGTTLTGHALYTQATQLMAKEPDVYITENVTIEDRLTQYVEEEKAKLDAAYAEERDVKAEKAARERMKKELDKELEALNRKVLGFE